MLKTHLLIVFRLIPIFWAASLIEEKVEFSPVSILVNTTFFPLVLILKLIIPLVIFALTYGEKPSIPFGWNSFKKLLNLSNSSGEGFLPRNFSSVTSECLNPNLRGSAKAGTPPLKGSP